MVRREQRRISEDYKAPVAALAQFSGKRIGEISAGLNLADGAVGEWRPPAAIDAGKRVAAIGASQDRRLDAPVALRRRLWSPSGAKTIVRFTAPTPGFWSRFMCGLAAMAVTACASPASSPGTSTPIARAQTPSPTPTPAGFFTLTVRDSVQNATDVPCPAGTSSSAQCFTLVGAGTSPRLGTFTVAPILDVEYPSGQAQCGAPHIVLEKLMFVTGNVVVDVAGPYLCLGVTGITQRTFSVLSGTGTLTGATGSGTIDFDTLAVGADEIWRGTLLIGPGH